jgi:hypothetical protein
MGVTPFLHTTLVIKNLVKDVSNERAIDALTQGIRRADFIEEMGRIKPRTIAELIEVANRFADGEDAYHKKKNKITQR